MKGSLKKVIVSVGFLVISLVLVVSVSYAWFSMSGSPETAGISIRIGGSQTIQIAPDITVEQDGEILHYPGKFSEDLHIAGRPEYAYLQELAGLLPVSTADGLYWFTPDRTVDERKRTLDDYRMDDVLEFANLEKDTAEMEGHYIYLDFWVAAPMDCDMRVSTGTDGQGSFLIALPEAVDSETGGWQLSTADNEAANCARVGFMTNTLTLNNGSMEAYIKSEFFNEKYTRLSGIYQEPGIPALNYEPDQKFTIYEPNGEVHTGTGFSYVQTNLGSRIVTCQDGEYIRTQPIGQENGKVVLADISDRLFVQKENVWKETSSGSTLLNEIFQGYVHQNVTEDQTAEEAVANYYTKSIQGQFSPYLTPGLFYPVTENLYSFGADNGELPVTAVEDAVLVTLEKNVPQRIRMYVWLEGQDVDCVREAALDSFALGLEFAGSTE